MVHMIHRQAVEPSAELVLTECRRIYDDDDDDNDDADDDDDRISRHFRSIRNFFLQNGCRRPFWMTENHF